MQTEDDLRAAVATALLHCRPGGATLFAPDYLRETFHPSTHHGGHDAGCRALRYLEWTWDPDPQDSTYTCDLAYLLGEEGGQVRVVHDRHLLGLFSRGVWLRVMAEAGFEPLAVPFEHSGLEPGSAGISVGVRPLV